MSVERLIRDGEVKMLHFTNAEGKEWMIPLEGVKTGLLLYQPSGWKGHLVKRLLPMVGRWGWGRRLLHTNIKKRELNQDIRDAIAKAFGVDDFNFSIFFGTPCADQKVTIQIFKDTQVLGYCKVADSAKVGRKFQQEMDLLGELNEKGVHGIPQGMACGKTNEGLFYFAQTTTKTLKSTYPHEWGNMQEKFIQNMHERTKTPMPFEQTDFYRAIEQLKKRMDWLNNEQQHTIGKAIETIESHFMGKIAEWSVYHGDFTPWNTFVNNGQFFVFDWEYALRSCPPKMDKYHWFTQVCIFEKHYNTEHFFKVYHKKGDFTDNFSYLCYLLLTIAIYVGREERPEDVQKIKLLDIWVGLIKGIMKK